MAENGKVTTLLPAQSGIPNIKKGVIKVFEGYY